MAEIDTSAKAANSTRDSIISLNAAREARKNQPSATPSQQEGAKAPLTRENPLDRTQKFFNPHSELVPIEKVDAATRNTIAEHIATFYQTALDLRSQRPSDFASNPIYQSIIDIVETHKEFFQKTVPEAPSKKAEERKKGLFGSLFGKKEEESEKKEEKTEEEKPKSEKPESTTGSLAGFNNQELIILDGALRLAADELAHASGVEVIDPNRSIRLLETRPASEDKYRLEGDEQKGPGEQYQLLEGKLPSQAPASLDILQSQFHRLDHPLSTPYGEVRGFTTEKYNQYQRLHEVGELVNARIALTEALTGKKAWDSLEGVNRNFGQDRLSTQTEIYRRQLVNEQHPGKSFKDLTPEERIKINRRALSDAIVEIGANMQQVIGKKIERDYAQPELTAQAKQRAEELAKQTQEVRVYKKTVIQPDGSKKEEEITFDDWKKLKDERQASTDEINKRTSEITSLEETRIPELERELNTLTTQENELKLTSARLNALSVDVTKYERELASLQAQEQNFITRRGQLIGELKSYAITQPDYIKILADSLSDKKQSTQQGQVLQTDITLSEAKVTQLTNLVHEAGALQRELEEINTKLERLKDLRSKEGVLAKAREDRQTAQIAAQKLQRLTNLRSKEGDLEKARRSLKSSVTRKAKLTQEHGQMPEPKETEETETRRPPEAEQIEFIIGEDLSGTKYRDNLSHVNETFFSAKQSETLQNFDTFRATLFGVEADLKGQQMARTVCSDEVLINSLGLAMGFTPERWLQMLNLQMTGMEYFKDDGTIDWNSTDLYRGIGTNKDTLLRMAKEGLIQRLQKNLPSTNVTIATQVLRERLKAASLGTPTAFTGHVQSVAFA